MMSTVLLLPFAAAGLVGLPEALRAAGARGLALPALAVLVAAVFCNWPILDRAYMRSVTHYNLGNELFERQQPEAAMRVQSRGLSVRQTEQLVKSMSRSKPAGDKRSGGRAAHNADIALLEDDLSKRIGARVTIQHGARKGKLVIHYHSLDELDGILEKIK